MSGAAGSTPVPGERWWVTLLVAATAARVFVFASALPFFNGIDEHRHVDTVEKYARGVVPGPDDTAFDALVATLMVDWGTPEYRPDSEVRSAASGPLALRDLDPEEEAKRLASIRHVAGWRNVQAHAPPVYYALAAQWLHLGRALGFRSIGLFYWVRWLNALAMAALAAASWLLLRRLYPQDALPRLGVPLLVAVYPNDFQYGVTNDALGPLLGGLGFLLLARLVREERPPLLVFVAAGLCGALLLLTKINNASFLGIAALACAVALATHLRDARRASDRGADEGDARAAESIRGRLGRELLGWSAMWAVLLVPVAAWLVRNHLVLGDWTGAALKTEGMRVLSRSPGTWLEHPLVRDGLASWRVFLHSVITTFWRGEFRWRGEPMQPRWLDTSYVVLSLLLPALAALAWPWRRHGARATEGLALASVAVGVATLAGLSLGYEIDRDYFTPWSEFPYVYQARLIGWALVPLALLFVRGLEVACSPLPGRARRLAPWLLLALFAAVVTGSELAYTSGAFASAYNWFHVAGRAG